MHFYRINYYHQGWKRSHICGSVPPSPPFAYVSEIRFAGTWSLTIGMAASKLLMAVYQINAKEMSKYVSELLIRLEGRNTTISNFPICNFPLFFFFFILVKPEGKRKGASQYRKPEILIEVKTGQRYFLTLHRRIYIYKGLLPAQKKQKMEKNCTKWRNKRNGRGGSKKKSKRRARERKQINWVLWFCRHSHLTLGILKERNLENGAISQISGKCTRAARCMCMCVERNKKKGKKEANQREKKKRTFFQLRYFILRVFGIEK